MKRIGVLGSTGSIGRTALKVISNDQSKAVLLVNNFDLDGLKEQIKIFHPETALCLSANYMYKDGKEYTVGSDVLSDPELYSNCDIVLNGVVGLAGLKPSLAVLRSGKILATANKESFVCAGKIINSEKIRFSGKIYPVDSEHSAVWQLMDGKPEPEKIFITASGGAFRDLSEEKLRDAKAKDALKHPNWVMGKKVTIDCATLMNKGMEVIEAKHLFGRIPEIIGHRESYVHAMVRYADGTYNANISRPDMAVPISYALHYPEIKKTFAQESLCGKTISFFDIDRKRFPCLSIAERAAELGDIAGCVMNAADEILVEKYLRDEIKFYDIPEKISKAMDRFAVAGDFSDPNDVYGMDKAVREYTLSICRGGY